jgi:membrane dipeptidase
MDNIGVGCTERVDAGLSMYGVDVVKHCNDIGVIVDTSHCGRLTTLDACRHSSKPVNANHTCAKALSNVARAKTDEELKAIAETGGVIGVVTVPFFITRQPPATIQHVLDHIDYIADLVGWRHVALGTDWPLQAPDDVHAAMAATELADLGFRPEDNVDVTRGVVGFRDYRVRMRCGYSRKSAADSRRSNSRRA